MFTKDLKLYPIRLKVRLIADRHITGFQLELAARNFAEDYRDDMKLLQHPMDKPPCMECSDKMLYVCYLTGCECRAWAVWDQYWDRVSTKDACSDRSDAL